MSVTHKVSNVITQAFFYHLQFKNKEAKKLKKKIDLILLYYEEDIAWFFIF